MNTLIKVLVLIFFIIPFSVSYGAETKSEKKHESMEKKDHKEHSHKGPHDHKDDKATAEFIDAQNLVIKVKGMVCAFCAQGVEKSFNKREEVESTKVNLDTMEVQIKLKKGKTLNEELIKKLVTDAGFSFVGIIK